MPPLIIDIDKYKEQIPNYNPDNASEFHTQSAKMADIVFDEAIKSKKYRNVIFLCGGSALGKTEFVKTHLSDEGKEIVIWRNNMSGFDEFLKEIKDAGLVFTHITTDKQNSNTLVTCQAV